MKIVIEISEEKYTKLVMEEEHIRACGSYYPVMILDGTPLPKGHGRLIDADKLMEYAQNSKDKTVDCNDIARFPCVLGADRMECECIS